MFKLTQLALTEVPEEARMQRGQLGDWKGENSSWRQEQLQPSQPDKDE